MPALLYRKIWVKRRNDSATLVQVREDDLVDNLRDAVLAKYANSLGKTFDSPDLVLRIVVSRGDGATVRGRERTLGPEVKICSTLDAIYPAGQTVNEALIVDVPTRTAPRPSPRVSRGDQAVNDWQHHVNGQESGRSSPSDTQPKSPHAIEPYSGQQYSQSVAAADLPRSKLVLNSDQLSPLPSPGVGRHRLDMEQRSASVRQHTPSPIRAANGSSLGAASASIWTQPPVRASSRTQSRAWAGPSASEQPQGITSSSSPVPSAPQRQPIFRKDSVLPTPCTPSAPSQSSRNTQSQNASQSTVQGGEPGRGNPILSAGSGMLHTSVPPINVLVVEDNEINSRYVERMLTRMKVRWQRATNGQIAVDKWRAGGNHLVLMDIRMPVMNGIQATKEIRRLEKRNGIGAFSSLPISDGRDDSETADRAVEGRRKVDALPMAEGLFKSPIIVVALTASALDSDRHEALAAGCNDYLTKPIGPHLLEHKVREWGCMQALIDFDGWRKWVAIDPRD